MEMEVIEWTEAEQAKTITHQSQINFGKQNTKNFRENCQTSTNYLDSRTMARLEYAGH